MATFITGAIVAVGLYYALRHVYRNFRMGREDCCGGNCSACSGHCMGGHAALPKKGVGCARADTFLICVAMVPRSFFHLSDCADE